MIYQTPRAHHHRDATLARMPVEPNHTRWTSGDIAILAAALLVMVIVALACLGLFWRISA